MNTTTTNDAGASTIPPTMTVADTEPAPPGGLRMSTPIDPPRGLTIPQRAGSLRDVLAQRIAEGTARAGSVIETLHHDVPTDQIAKAASMTFAGHHQGLVVHVGDLDFTPSTYALGQLAARAGVPAPYLAGLVEGQLRATQDEAWEANAWRRDLAATILGRHFSHDPGRILARSVRGQLRGVLSDKYRRLDCRPLVDALVEECSSFGAIPFDGTATETRVALKVIFPEVLEPLPGEYLVVGGEWSNSDFGNGAHSFRAFFLRATCLNGATMENVLRQVHLGGRLADDLVFSDRTYRLDTETSISALRDTVRATLGPDGRVLVTKRIQAAQEQGFSKEQLVRVARGLTKADSKAVVDAFESQDVINLPAGKTAWRASNALSWIARNTEDAEKRLDLERLAGSIVAGSKADPKE